MRITRSIYIRLAAVFLFLLSLSGVLQLFLAMQGFTQLAATVEQRRNWGIATAISDRIQKDVYPNFDTDLVSRRLLELHDLNPGLRIAVLDAKGRVLARSPVDLLWDISRVGTDELEAALAIVTPDLPLSSRVSLSGSSQSVLSDEIRSIFSVAAVELPQERGYVYVEYDLFHGSTLQRVGMLNLTRMVIVGFLAILFVSTLLGAAAFFAITKRFRRATSLLSSFAAGNFSDRLADSRQDELGEMARAIDFLADAVVSSKRQLESRDLQRRELIANITHDLRNPLTAMRARLDVLLKRVRTQPESALQEARSDVDVLVRNTDLQQRLVLDLFELSKLEATQKVILDEVSLGRSATSVVERMHSVAAQAGISLQCEPIGEFDDEVLADRSLIERAIGNLIENAIRYAPQGTAIKVIVSPDERGVKVAVQDFGRGISPAIASTLFEAGSRDADSPGAGLGLSIVKRIIDIHSGSLHCDSVLEVGTVISFILPQNLDNSEDFS